MNFSTLLHNNRWETLLFRRILFGRRLSLPLDQKKTTTHMRISFFPPFADKTAVTPAFLIRIKCVFDKSYHPISSKISARHQSTSLARYTGRLEETTEMYFHIEKALAAAARHGIHIVTSRTRAKEA